jgi:hypothetical protein
VHNREEVNASAVQAPRGARINKSFSSPHTGMKEETRLCRIMPCYKSYLLQSFATNMMLNPIDCSAHSRAYYEAMLLAVLAPVDKKSDYVLPTTNTVPQVRLG